MKQVELLSPAGNMESMRAAIFAGCDAVYLGGYMFGARSYAGNFSNEELVEAIKYAHIHGVRVYVTVNTIIYENEVDMFLEYIDFLHQNNVDAVIMQDLGMMDLVRQTYPNLEIHASTQMHIHNLESAKVVEELGLARTVLARETSIDDIKKIRENTKMELEIFVHGALCISYSGQCLMSKMIGGRSGNRGSCAGSCRLPYNLFEGSKKVNKHDYVLSMKDLNSLENLESLLKVGVDSLKIEGRMKRPEYVYLVTSIYRKAIDSFYKNGLVKITKEEISELEKIYNRYFTKGFLFNEENTKITNDYRPNHMGVLIGKVVGVNRGKTLIKLSGDISIHDGIRIVSEKEEDGFEVNQFYINNKLVKKASIGDTIAIETRTKPEIGASVVKTSDIEQLNLVHEKWKDLYRPILIRGTFKCQVGSPMLLIVTDGVNKIEVCSDNLVDKAQNKPTTKEDLIKQLDRLKDTCYKWEKLNVETDGMSFVPKSQINELRRKMVEVLNEKRCYKIPYKKGTYISKLPPISLTHFHSIYIEDLEGYNKVKSGHYDNIYINNLDDYLKIKEDKRVIYRAERALTTYPNLDNIMISELGGVFKYKNFITDTSFNVVNSYTMAFLYRMGASRITLSYELEENQIKEMIDAFKKRLKMSPNVEVVTDGYPEILLTKVNIPLKYKSGSNLTLKDRKGKTYSLKYFNNLTHIYHSDAINLNQKRLENIGITNFCKHL